MTIFPSRKGVSVRREVFQSTKQTPIKLSLLLALLEDCGQDEKRKVSK